MIYLTEKKWYSMKKYKENTMDNIEEIKYSSKELAMFKAVIDLIDEAADINKLKVSDITSKAGIGKGTAYEYFKSKEEIIAKAISYDMKERGAEILSLVENSKCFKDKFYGILDWITKNSNGNRSVIEYFKIIYNSYDIENSIKVEFFKVSKPEKDKELLFRSLIKSVYEENIADRGVEEYYVYSALVSQLMGFIVYTSCKCSFVEHVDETCAKDFAYNSFLKIFKQQ